VTFESGRMGVSGKNFDTSALECSLPCTGSFGVRRFCVMYNDDLDCCAEPKSSAAALRNWRC
jgi:hypothetical protein